MFINLHLFISDEIAYFKEDWFDVDHYYCIFSIFRFLIWQKQIVQKQTMHRNCSKLFLDVVQIRTACCLQENRRPKPEQWVTRNFWRAAVVKCEKRNAKWGVGKKRARVKMHPRQGLNPIMLRCNFASLIDPG